MGREAIMESFSKIAGATLLGGWVSMKELKKVSEISIQGLYKGMDAAVKSGDVEKRVVTIVKEGKTYTMHQFRQKKEESYGQPQERLISPSIQ